VYKLDSFVGFTGMNSYMLKNVMTELHQQLLVT
jgi:hypothetical protein